ncbi:EscU/YscU/HrcU family type III secretion system export apparatus switch protein [Piscibacillus sp. B03]|uniref:EscU/YscU/HrcU family type III secretion system export apparatus switch protein n=1 Tax=Piscibacillus sp. B03 TaxID=3457430 RepID=UPI003FCE883F
MNKRQKAFALKYDEQQDDAPKVVAKGQGLVASEILERANESNVPVYEDETLVNLLDEININETIPEDLYKIVAEVFAFIYQTDKKID